MPDLIGTAEAARRLGVSQRRVRQLIDTRRLPAQLIGGRYIVDAADLNKVRSRPAGRPKKKRNK